MKPASVVASANRRLWLRVALVIAAGLTLSLVQVHCVSDRDVRLEATAALFDGSRTYMGDPGPSLDAARRLSRNPRARLYDVDFGVGSAFIYPPLAAAPYAPLARLRSDEARRDLMLINHLLFVAILCTLLRLLAGRAALRWSQIVGTLLAVGVFYPLVHAVEMNQSMVAATLLLGVAWIALDEDRQPLAGALLAGACLFKPQLALMLPLLWWHARGVIRGALVTALALGIASLLYAGVASHVEYVTHVLPLLSRGYSYYANQSWNGLFNRLFATQDIGEFALPPRIVAVQWLAGLFSLATYGAALALAYRWRRAPARMWMFGFAWLTVTLVSPISWQHHYSPLLFVLALAWRELDDDDAARLWLPLTLGFTLTASYFEVRSLTGAPARLLASYLFAGGLLCTATLAYHLERLTRRSSSAAVAASGDPRRA